VRTKFSKTMTTFFFPVHAEFLAVVLDWIGYLRDTLWWGPDDPLFPATKIERGTNRLFRAAGLTRMHWRNANSIRKIFKASFEVCGLPYFNPHTFRSTLAQLGERICRTPEQFKAWSQNLGHEGVMTTFSSYGRVAPLRQSEIMMQLRPDRGDPTSLMELLQHALVAAQKAESAKAAPN
jgi:integrase